MRAGTDSSTPVVHARMERAKKARHTLLTSEIHDQRRNTAVVSEEGIGGPCLVSDRFKYPQTLVNRHSRQTRLRRRFIEIVECIGTLNSPLRVFLDR